MNTPANEKSQEESLEDLIDNAKSRIDENLRLMYNGKPYITPANEWREEFKRNRPKADDKLFGANCESETYAFGYKYMDGDTIHEVTDWGNIENFIQETLNQHSAQIVERIEELKKEQLDKNDPDNYGACYAIEGHNRAIDQAIDIIKEQNK